MKFMNSNARTFLLLAKGRKQIRETLNSVTSGGSIRRKRERERERERKREREANYFTRGWAKE